jgi:predicted NBD/HSP70 family sugar kinase
MSDVIVLLAGERLGAGLFVEGRLLHGHGGRAGEMGFLTQVKGVDGPEGIAKRARDLDARTRLAEGSGAAETSPAAPTAEAIFAAARAGEPDARAVADRVAEAMAGAIAPLAGLLDPELVVISGAVAQACDVLLDRLEARLADLIPAPPRVVGSSLGDRAVALGAARLGLDLVEGSLRLPR